MFPAALLAVVLAATACGNATLTTTKSPPQTVQSAPPPIKVSFHGEHVLAAADAAFARTLWTKLEAGGGNVVVSPTSIATALEMVYVGARGQTAAEMARVLHLPPGTPTDDVLTSAGGLFTQLETGGGKDSFAALADEVWVQRDFPVVPAFQVAMESAFGSVFNLADFAAHGEDARKAINAAIAGQTRDRIQDLLPAGTDLSAARLVLTNAIYLKAAWETPFDAKLTKAAPFTRDDGTVVRPQTMNDSAEFDYAATPGYQAVRIPYAGGRLAMTLLLPAKGKPLAWPGTAPHFATQMVDLALPKFTFTWGDDLASLLAQLGMPDAFTDAANFGGISTKPLKIGTVRHKAFISVDENGTEAAAATAVEIRAGAGYAPGQIATLHFNRPFLFRIDDTTTGLPLFLGKVADPTLGA